MSRYIDSEDVIKAIEAHIWDDDNGYDEKMALEIVENAPTADVVPVVRCKDCKHCYYADNRVMSQRSYVCDFTGEDIADLHFFCGHGTKKKYENRYHKKYYNDI